jgi:hypothetical protein
VILDYSIFDGFCKTPTWNTSHALDERRFHDALHEVVMHPDFSPETMGEYIRLNHGQTIWPKTPDQINQVIRKLVADAWVVKNFVSGRMSLQR